MAGNLWGPCGIDSWLSSQSSCVPNRTRGSRLTPASFKVSLCFFMEKAMAPHSSTLCLENPRDGGAWWAAVHGVTPSRTRLKRLSSSSFFKGLNLDEVLTAAILAPGFLFGFPSHSSFPFLFPFPPFCWSFIPHPCSHSGPSLKGLHGPHDPPPSSETLG